MSDQWIVIPNWERHQHYKDRSVPWIKLYTELNRRDDWRRLTHAERGLLCSIWLEYAAANGVLRLADVTGRVGQRTRNRHVNLLVEAGWLSLLSSKPLARAGARARARSREVQEQRETPPTPPRNGGAQKLSQKQVRKYTGCRQTRGSHGFGFVRDPLGTDKPPADWPYERPSKEEVGAALAATTHGGGEQPPEGA